MHSHGVVAPSRAESNHSQPGVAMEAPRRIASLLAGATEMLFGMGLGDRVVAVSHECDWPSEVASLPRDTWSRVDGEQSSGDIDRQVRESRSAGWPLYEIDGPALARLAPELIVTQAQCDVCAVRYEDVVRLVADEPALSAARVVALNPATLDDILADIERVGRAAGAVDAAKVYVGDLRRRIARVADTTARVAAADRSRVAVIEWIEPLMLASNWTPGLIDLAGGRHGLVEPGLHSTCTQPADLVEFDPQVLVISPCGFDLPRTLLEAPALAQMPGWNRISAVKSGRVYGVDGNALFNRSGPRLVDTLELLAHLVHPDRCDSPASLRSPPSLWQGLPTMPLSD